MGEAGKREYEGGTLRHAVLSFVNCARSPAGQQQNALTKGFPFGRFGPVEYRALSACRGYAPPDALHPSCMRDASLVCHLALAQLHCTSIVRVSKLTPPELGTGMLVAPSRPLPSPGFVLLLHPKRPCFLLYFVTSLDLVPHSLNAKWGGEALS